MKLTEDIDLINKVKFENDNDALRELESRHTGIYNEIVKKYYKHLIDFGVNANDVSSDKLFVLYKSIMSFDPSKNVKFSTWLGNQARYYCLNCINKKNNTLNMDQDNLISLLEKNQMKSNDNLSRIKEKSDQIFSILSRIKDDRIQKIFKLRYFQGAKPTPWSKIGKKLKVSTQTVINLHEKGRVFLKNKLTADLNSDII
jgi:RNA polymerase sigma factor (sigma-70 family)